jgi:hypothetical protein
MMMISVPLCNQEPIFPQPRLRILQVQTVEQFQQFEAGILDLLSIYQSVFLDDFCEPNPMTLVNNTRTYLPWLWLLVEEEHASNPQAVNNAAGVCSDEAQKNCTCKNCPTKITKKTVYGLACLSDVIPGRHAFVHGVSHPKIRKHSAISTLGKHVLDVAFNTLHVRKVKAEIEANNTGAIGYCRRMGFVREGYYKQDNRIAGQWLDVLVYSLFAERFQVR